MKRYLTSLRFKITAGAIVLLVPILGAYSHLQYYRQYDIMLENMERETTAMGQVITASLRHAFVANDAGEMTRIVGDVAAQKEIVNLAVLDQEGVVRIAPKDQAIGTRLDEQDPSCQVCHRYSPQERQGSVILNQPSGRVFRTMTPIRNAPECYGCHDSAAWLNGVLLTDISMAGVDTHMADNLRNSIMWSLAAMVLTVAAIHLMMSRLVVSRLEQFVKTIKRFGQGEWEERVGIGGGDEIEELAQAFDRMADGLQRKEKENQHLYQELQRREELRGQLLEKLNHVQEQERKRIADDLHDHLGQVLGAMAMEVQAAERALPPEQAALKERLRHAQAVAESAVEQTHALILDLRPIVLDDLGLVAAVRSYAEQLLSSREVEVQVEVKGTRCRLAPELEITLFRIVQEAINNVANHANARQVTLGFDFDDLHLRVVVQDDGCGFGVPSRFEPVEVWRGLGLLGMQERTERAGCTFQIESEPGHGTRVVITVPIRNKRAPGQALLASQVSNC